MDARDTDVVQTCDAVIEHFGGHRRFRASEIKKLLDQEERPSST